MPHNKSLMRASICLLSMALSFVIIAVIGARHTVIAERAASGDSSVGTGIFMSYLIVWPGLAVFAALFADGVYLAGRLSTKPFARALIHGAIPIALNFVFLLLSSAFSYPVNGYVLLAGFLVGVLAPFVALGLGYRRAAAT